MRKFPSKEIGLSLAATAALAGCGSAASESEPAEPTPTIVSGYVTPEVNDPSKATVDTCITFTASDGIPRVARIEMIQTDNGGPNLARRLTTGASSPIGWNGDRPENLTRAGVVEDGELACSFEVTTPDGRPLRQGMAYIALGSELVPQSIVGPFGPDTVQNADCPPVTIEGYEATTAGSPRLGCVALYPLGPNS
jgi:hypothetical protein